MRPTLLLNARTSSGILCQKAEFDSSVVSVLLVAVIEIGHAMVERLANASSLRLDRSYCSSVGHYITTTFHLC